MQEVSLLFAVLEENWLEIFGVGNRVSHALLSSRVAQNIHLSGFFFLLLAAVQPYVVSQSAWFYPVIQQIQMTFSL